MRRSVTTLLATAAFLVSTAGSMALAADRPAESAGSQASQTSARPNAAANDRVVVMYFHRTQRCPTCMKMGTYTDEAVKNGFAKEMASGRVSLHFIDFQDPKNAEFAQAYGITGPTLIVAQVSGEKVAEYKNLKEMWAKVRDKNAFLEYVQGNVRSYLK